MPARLEKIEDECLRVKIWGEKAEFQELLSKAKAIAGRRWNPEAKAWDYPCDERTALKIMGKLYPDANAAVLQWVRGASAKAAEELTTDIGDPLDPDFDFPGVTPSLADHLMPYQQAAVAVIAERKRVLLGDVMGLGKTRTAICGALEVAWNERSGPRVHLIVAPNSVLSVWRNEIYQVVPGAFQALSATIVDGSTPKRRLKQLGEWKRQVDRATADTDWWLIVNWEKIGRVQNVLDFLEQFQWNTIIADEAHRIKNKDAQQTKKLDRLHAPVQIACSGTPIMNSPDEVWAPLHWLRPDRYMERSPTKTTYWQFYHQYVEYYEGPSGKVVTGVNNPDALRFELKDVLIRRTGGTPNVARDLKERFGGEGIPPLLPPTNITVKMEGLQKRLYKEAEDAVFLEIERALSSAETVEERQRLEAAIAAGDPQRIALLIEDGAARITRLRQIALSPAVFGGEDESAKLSAAVEIIADQQPKQFVVFGWYKDGPRLLLERLAKRGITAATYTGDDSLEQRDLVTRKFQLGEIDVILATIAAGGEGVTWTAADTAIFIEEDWVPAKNAQAIARLHRIGQRNPVNHIVIRASGTIDTGRIAPANRLKSLIVESVFGEDGTRT